MNEKLAVMILACDRNAASVAQMLDEAQVGDWTIVPAVQARRLGYLQHVLPRHPEGSSVIFGFGERNVITHALETLAQAERENTVCPDCVAHIWEVQQVPLSQVALDPVCDEVVDRDRAPTADYQGTHYYFCSKGCQDDFLQQPDAYLRRKVERRVGRRELEPAAHTLS